jgi:hypothetical protein
MKYSFSEGPTTVGTYYIDISKWSIGIMEEGSSGAPLFGNVKRIIGVIEL